MISVHKEKYKKLKYVKHNHFFTYLQYQKICQATIYVYQH